MIRLFFVGVICIFSVSCSIYYTRSEYVVDSNVDNVEVEFNAIDKFQFGDAISIDLYTRNSCNQKPDYSRLAKLSRNIFNSDIYSVFQMLPSNKVLNISLEHSMSGDGGKRYICKGFKSYKLQPNNKYKLIVRNRSTERSAFDGFGCDFDMYIIDSTLDKNLPLEQVKPAVPTCK